MKWAARIAEGILIVTVSSIIGFGVTVMAYIFLDYFGAFNVSF